MQMRYPVHPPLYPVWIRVQVWIYLLLSSEQPSDPYMSMISDDHDHDRAIWASCSVMTAALYMIPTLRSGIISTYVI